MINALELYRQIRDEWDKTSQPLQERASILPLGQYEDGSVGLAVPGIINQGLEGIQNFGRYGYDSPEAIRDNAGHAFDAAGLAMTGGLGAGIAGIADNALSGVRKPDVSDLSDVLFGSRNAKMYPPPNRDPRPFEADYRRGARADDAGRLTHDIDGNPLTARYVAGRTVVGGGDEAIPETELDALSEAIFGSRISPVARREIGGDSGRFQVGAGPDGPEYRLYFANDLSDAQIPRVGAHELSHGIDYLAAGRHGIPDDEIKRELAGVYDTLNNPNRSRDGAEAASWGQRARPQDFGYKGADIPAEHMAEAVRAYMADPNYLKTVAPKTAARIREYVNSNPRLNKIIQFNANAPTGAAIPLGMSGAQDDTDIEPALMQYLRLIGAD